MRFVRESKLIVVGASLAAMLMGCQSSPTSSTGASTSSKHSAEQSLHEQWAGRTDQDEPYFDPNYRDDDQPRGVVSGAFAAAGRGFGSFFGAIIDVPVSAAKWLGGDKPGNAARMMEDETSADNRRQGINKLLEYDFTKRDPYTARYRQIAMNDADATVRAAAIRAGNRARDAKATPVFVRGLDDRSDWVQLESAKALANVPDNAAVTGLLKLLMNPETNRDVRIASADALKHYRTLTVARALVKVLGDRDFGVSWQARRSLKYLFGRDLGYNDSAWLEYLSGPQSPVK